MTSLSLKAMSVQNEKRNTYPICNKKQDVRLLHELRVIVIPTVFSFQFTLETTFELEMKLCTQHEYS